MRNRLNLIVAAFLIMVGVVLWTTLRPRGPATPLVATTPGPLPQTVTIRVQTVAPAAPNTPAPSISPVTETTPGIVPPDAGPTDKSKYTARAGDTVSNLAAELPGGDKKINRDAVIDANPSLQRNPDLVLAGKTYQIPATPLVPEVVAPPAAPVTTPPAVATAPEEPVHELRYIARPGDTVSTMAAALLGGDTKETRDAIIGANISLQNDPDRVLAGQVYRIPVRESQPLASAPASAIATAPRPTTQPDADKVLLAASPRELRYTAKPGDNVSTLATALLGGDTRENREAIINNNESLKQDPDHVVAGTSYWIPAPAAPQP